MNALTRDMIVQSDAVAWLKTLLLAARAVEISNRRCEVARG